MYTMHLTLFESFPTQYASCLYGQVQPIIHEAIIASNHIA